jgi:peptidoglycan/LPS O-acetylase OafA/YrhL
MRIVPISSVRFFLAVLVFLSHFPYPVFTDHQSNPFLWIVRSILRNSFNGPAAVIAFFVISGFCIHFPNRRRVEISSWASYYARRYVRILIPMGLAVALAIPLKLSLGLYINYILWSLLCEEIYYFLYPVLLRLRDLLGWRTLMTVVWVASFLALLTNPAAKEYHDLGPSLTWILGLPCWLMGVRMAERLDIFSAQSVGALQIWSWRVGVWVLSLGLSALRFHTVVGFPWTLNTFAIVATLWLQREVAYYYALKMAPAFEKMGDASYSVYLTHMHGAMLTRWITTMSTPLSWWLNVGITVIFASVFYLCIERPSHRLARSLSRRLAQRARVPGEVDCSHARAGEGTFQPES